MKYLAPLLFVFMIAACSKRSGSDVEPQPADPLPQIFCDNTITQNCIDDKWTVSTPSTAYYQILPNYYNGQNCLLLVNPHPGTRVNPPPIMFSSFIKNIKKNTPYRISCDVKIKGYPDFVNNPAFAFYAYVQGHWYGEHYYSSAPGIYHVSDWSRHSYQFISGEESTLSFQFYSLYDSTWISNFRIEEL